MQNENMPKKIAWIRRRGAKRVVIGAVMASIIILLVLTSFFYTPYDPNATDLKARMVGPSAKHLFGTDQLGRDILSRVMSGGRVSLSIATMALLGTTVLGVVTGMLAGYYEGASDAVFNMIAEIRQSMPMMLIMIVFLAVFGSSILTMGIIAGLTKVITPEGAKEAIRKFFNGKSEKVIALNEKAFDLGYEKGAALQEETV